MVNSLIFLEVTQRMEQNSTTTLFEVYYFPATVFSHTSIQLDKICCRKSVDISKPYTVWSLADETKIFFKVGKPYLSNAGSNIV